MRSANAIPSPASTSAVPTWMSVGGICSRSSSGAWYGETRQSRRASSVGSSAALMRSSTGPPMNASVP